MIDRYRKAIKQKKMFNTHKPENNTYLLQNSETGRIFYIQNYAELSNTMCFLTPGMTRLSIDYKYPRIIGKWNYVIEDNSNGVTMDKRPIIIRRPELILGLLS